MPLIETKGAASSQGVGQFARASGPAVYVEDVFSTWLYTGNGVSTTVVNGIDLADKGGLVWTKARENAYNNNLLDTARGSGFALFTNLTAGNGTGWNWTANSNGYTLPSFDNQWNQNFYSYVSWTFRKQPKFFDVVTYTGDGNQNRAISHSLGSTPGFIIIKRTDSVSNWLCYHRSVGANNAIYLNTTAGFNGEPTFPINPTSSVFYVQGNANAIGASYVAYVFAHDAGGFGLRGTDNVISCGSFTTDSSSNATVTLGWEPQFVMVKSSSVAGNWIIVDSIRGIPTGGGTDRQLYPNLTNADTATATLDLSATGFNVVDSLAASTAFVYVAIRRGPMKTPTSGSSVFNPNAFSSPAATQITTGTTPDLIIARARNSTDNTSVYDRLRGFADTNATGQSPYLYTNSTAVETSAGSPHAYQVWNAGYRVGNALPSISAVYQSFSRAPDFFDIVCYKGTGTSGANQPHNLGVRPELVIYKMRNVSSEWYVSYAPNASSAGWVRLKLNTGEGNTAWSAIDLAYLSTATNLYTTNFGTIGTAYSSANHIAYLFASCPGVSKVGSYTGTGTTQQINCGFTGGARFVMIKRTDSTGDWYVWDSARGIVAGNDPYLLLNSTAAEVTNTDFIDPLSTGFEISSTAPAAINANGGTFIYLAIA